MKIVILGQYNAGKSSLVRSICKGSSISIDKYGTTVSLDHGLAIKYGIRLNIFGTPGLERFEILRKILSDGADGVIFVVDSVNHADFSEAKDLYLTLRKQLPNTPVIIGANKQDLDGSLAPEKILSTLNFPENKYLLTALPISAKTGKGVDKLLSILILTVLSRYKEILLAVRNGGKQGLQGIKKSLKIKPKTDKDLHDFIQWLSWRGLVTGNWEDHIFTLPERIDDLIEIFEYFQAYNPIQDVKLFN